MSQSISLTVHLDEPCQENWNEMTPTQQGRFCNKCEKPVVDFTGFSDQQMLQYFLDNPFPVCGRIRSSQRHQTIVATAPKINRSLSPVAATLLTLTAIATEAKAHIAPHPVIIQQVPPDNKTVAPTPTDSILISGTVKDQHGAPLENAQIVFGELKLLSDKNGYFQFTVPAIHKPAVLNFSYGKLEPETRSYHPVMGSTSYEVVLSEGYFPYIMGGLISDVSLRLHLPDPISTFTFRTSNKLDRPTRDSLSHLASLLRNNPNLLLSLKSRYKTSPKKAAYLTKQVIKYLVDSEGISEDRFVLPKPQHEKNLTFEVIIEFKQSKPEE